MKISTVIFSFGVINGFAGVILDSNFLMTLGAIFLCTAHVCLGNERIEEKIDKLLKDSK